MSLPRLDFKEEVENYEALSERREVEFNKCPHKQTKLTDRGLKCSCGASWYGPRQQMEQLQILLQKR